MKAIQITEYGGPEVLRYVDLPDPVPRPGQELVRVAGAGVNYADTHATENTYLTQTRLPAVPGAEVVGTGPDGRRVVALVSGGYAELAVAGTDLMFEVPDGVSDGAALALVLQGVTAWHLLRTSTHLAEGETVVVHAAAGGVGTVAVQLAKQLGAGRVVATASTPEKRELALDLGADAAVDPAGEGLKDQLVEANGGRPVDVVLEMTGGTVFDESLRSLAPFGRLATFGQASRQPARPVDPAGLMATSRGVIGFWLAHCLARPAMVREPLAELFELTLAGSLRPVVGGHYPLADASRAHRDLRGRGTVGKLVLDVDRPEVGQ
jgi:NADPH:quinone reductase